MSALDRRGDVIRALSATGEWAGTEWVRGRFTHKHKSKPQLTTDFSARGGVALSRWPLDGKGWVVRFAPSVPDAVVLAACTTAAAEAEQ